MILPSVTNSYTPRVEVQRNRQIEQADRSNHKRGQDVEMGGGKLILTSPDGSRYEVVVANDGTLSTNAV